MNSTQFIVFYSVNGRDETTLVAMPSISVDHLVTLESIQAHGTLKDL